MVSKANSLEPQSRTINSSRCTTAPNSASSRRTSIECPQESLHTKIIECPQESSHRENLDCPQEYSRRTNIECHQESFHQESGDSEESSRGEIFRSPQVRQNCSAQRSQLASDPKKKRSEYGNPEQCIVGLSQSRPTLLKDPNDDLLKQAPDSTLLSNRYKLLSISSHDWSS